MRQRVITEDGLIQNRKELLAVLSYLGFNGWLLWKTVEAAMHIMRLLGMFPA
jgi:hypothetical protein